MCRRGWRLLTQWISAQPLLQEGSISRITISRHLLPLIFSLAHSKDSMTSETWAKWTRPIKPNKPTTFWTSLIPTCWCSEAARTSRKRGKGSIVSWLEFKTTRPSSRICKIWEMLLHLSFPRLKVTVMEEIQDLTSLWRHRRRQCHHWHRLPSCPSPNKWL